MITNAILYLIVGLFTLLFGWLPVVTIADIPLIGSVLNSFLVTFIPTWYAFMETFPYAQIVWDIFLLGVIPFELLLLGAKFFLGNHTPIHG